MSKEINISISNLIPTLEEGCQEILCDNSGYTINFLFDEEWDGINTKTALFVCGDKTYDSVFDGSVCKVPRIKDGISCYIGVVSGKLTDAEKMPEKSTTAWCKVKAIPTITSIAKEPEAPEADVYIEIIALLNQYITGGGGGSGGEILVDQHYYPTSSRAQSGKAVAEAIKPIQEDVSAIQESLGGYDAEFVKLNKLYGEFDEVKETVEMQQESVDYSLATASEAKTVAKSLENTVSSLILDSNETRNMIWEETQRATNAETQIQLKNSELEKTKQDKVAFDGVYDKNTNQAATLQTVKREVAQEIAKIIANAPENFDTLKELSDWLISHSADAIIMNSKITSNLEQITTIKAEQSEQNRQISSNSTLANSAYNSANNALLTSNNAVSISNTALNNASQAKEQAEGVASQLEDISQSINLLESGKQDRLDFDGDYNAESNKVATVNTVASKVAEIVANAPSDFDTLKEVADYIASDKTGATEINNKLSEYGQKIAENETAISERVKKDEYATKDAAGVVKVNEAYGTRMVNGVLDLMPAQYSLIDSRSPNEYPLYMVSNGTRHQIVPANIDYAVKKVLSTDKLAGTAQAWTDEEKASARDLLGVTAILGDIDSALDSIISIQEALIGGESE